MNDVGFGFAVSEGMLRQFNTAPLRRCRSLRWHKACTMSTVSVHGTTSAVDVGSSVSSADIGSTPSSPSLPSSSSSGKFRVVADMLPTAEQPMAIKSVVADLSKHRFALLKGATGTGKTFVMGHAIAELGKPALILSHNKTLAAQLARELRAFLPNNSVEMFISYYDSFQPEAYNPKSDTYITKLAVVNKDIDALRHRATKALVERSDVVTVASISCIYGLGLPREYLESVRTFRVGQTISTEEIKNQLEDLMYENVKSILDLNRGCYHAKNEQFRIWPPYLQAPINLFVSNGEICQITTTETSQVHGSHQLAFPQPSDGDTASLVDGRLNLYPARHYVTPEERRAEAVRRIALEMEGRVKELTDAGEVQAAERLRAKVTEDLHMLEQLGFCGGVENYSRHLGLREEGDPPDTLMAFYDHAFGRDGWVLIVDESHVALPQLRAMYHGDRRRKESLVKHGFRLPSALDNRPLREDEFWDKVGSALFVSATPSKKELSLVQPEQITEMVIRPTGVMDPTVSIVKTDDQLEDLVRMIQDRADKEERVLVMAITKRDAEDLADYLSSRAIRCSYLHSGLKTVQRSEVIARLQRAEIDCIVGVNLLREGIDLPQVSLVCVMDADKQGFLRSKSSLLQMIGRAARHIHGEAVFFADSTSPAMRECIMETNIRRAKQAAYLEQHNLQPKSAKGGQIASLFEIEKEHNNRPEGEVDGADWETITNLLAEKKVVREETRMSLTKTDLMPVHIATLKEMVKTLPTKTGVYLWRSGIEDGEEVLYVGKAKNLRSRASSYLRGEAITTRGSRLAAMLLRARSVEVIVTPGGERDALLLEADLIKKHRPLYNVLLRDSRFYPYIVVTPKTDKQLPKVMTSVKPDHEGARYFGPFTSSPHLRRVMEILEGSLQLRQLRFQLRFGGKSVEADYLQAVDYATRALEGDVMAVAEELVSRGSGEAGRLLLALDNWNGANGAEQDRAWRRVAENARASKDVQTLLDLAVVPRRIEAFDVSHFHGEYTVASRVVFLDGEPARHLFRSYKLPHVNDDFASIHAAVLKRLHSKELRPDLIIIDGGRGQLSSALLAMKELGIAHEEVPICALAKQNEELFVPDRLKAVHSDQNSPAMLLIRNVRDESHQHAVRKMRFLRRTALNGDVIPSSTTTTNIINPSPAQEVEVEH